MNAGRLISNWLLLMFLASQVTMAQVTSATILGTVSDSTGAVIPGATINLRNVETGISRTVTTDEAGRYRAPQLGLGSYEVTAGSAGFQTAVRTGVTLTVGREATLDFTLQVGAVAERITVTGEAPLIETTNATVSSLVDQQTLQDLPLNGRSFSDLTAIQPGVVTNIGTTEGVFTGGRRMSMNGARPQQSLYLMDGLEVVAPYSNVAPSSVLNQFLGVDTIREFSILTNSYGAQYGRAIGGVVNSVTRAGTNEFHGSAFEFLRNDLLDARNFFDYKTKTNTNRLPPYRRNQFGAAAGGPIAKDSTFYFLSYEGIRERLGLTDNGTVLTQEARELGILRDKDGKITQTVKVNEAIRPILNLQPLPNTDDVVVGGIGVYQGTRTQAGQEDYGMTRIDRQLGEKDSLFGRLTIDNSSTDLPSLSRIPGGSMGYTRGSYRFAAISETRMVSPTLLNTASAGLARNNVREGSIYSTQGVDPRVFAVRPGDRIPQLNMPGISFTGGAMSPITSLWVDNTYEVSDTAIWTKGQHSLNIGVDIKRYQMNGRYDGWTGGWLYFSGVSAMLQGAPFRDITTEANADTYRGWRQTYGSLFVQDEYKVLPNLTVNLGLRWEVVSSPREVNGKISTVKDLLRDSKFVKLDKLFELEDGWKGFAPRLGIAWTPLGQRTVLRAGVGIFREIPLEYVYQLTMFVPPYAGRLQIENPTFPFPLEASGPRPTGEPLLIDTTFKYPTNYQWNFGIEQQLTETFVLKGTYIGTRGLNLYALNNPNQPVPQKDSNGRWFTPPTAPVPNPAFFSIRTTSSFGDAWYHALQLSAEQRYSNGLRFTTSYTWSKNMDSVPIGLKCAETVLSEFIVVNIYDVAGDRGRSALDTRHNFTMSYSYELPIGSGRAFGSNLTGIADAILGGWQLNGIFSMRTGLSQSPKLTYNASRNRVAPAQDRPDLLPGRNNNPIEGVTTGCSAASGIPNGETLGTPNRWFDPCAFGPPPAGYFGNAGRATITRPGLTTWDLSLFKKNRIGETHELEFRAELFNILNHANFGSFDNRFITSASGAMSPTAGQIKDTGGTIPRQIQFGLKYTF